MANVLPIQSPMVFKLAAWAAVPLTIVLVIVMSADIHDAPYAPEWVLPIVKILTDCTLWVVWVPLMILYRAVGRILWQYPSPQTFTLAFCFVGVSTLCTAVFIIKDQIPTQQDLLIGIELLFNTISICFEAVFLIIWLTWHRIPLLLPWQSAAAGALGLIRSVMYLVQAFASVTPTDAPRSVMYFWAFVLRFSQTIVYALFCYIFVRNRHLTDYPQHAQRRENDAAARRADEAGQLPRAVEGERGVAQNRPLDEAAFVRGVARQGALHGFSGRSWRIIAGAFVVAAAGACFVLIDADARVTLRLLALETGNVVIITLLVLYACLVKVFGPLPPLSCRARYQYCRRRAIPVAREQQQLLGHADNGDADADDKPPLLAQIFSCTAVFCAIANVCLVSMPAGRTDPDGLAEDEHLLDPLRWQNLFESTFLAVCFMWTFWYRSVKCEALLPRWLVTVLLYFFMFTQACWAAQTSSYSQKLDVPEQVEVMLFTFAIAFRCFSFSMFLLMALADDRSVFPIPAVNVIVAEDAIDPQPAEVAGRRYFGRGVRVDVLLC